MIQTFEISIKTLLVEHFSVKLEAQRTTEARKVISFLFLLLFLFLITSHYLYTLSTYSLVLNDKTYNCG